ncbi:MAG: hypothetical protein WCC53_08915 [Thermoanaerobaculia bacterium]
MATPTQATRAHYKNWEVAAFALFALGGGEKFVHTEEVALKCFDLAPGSFSWVRHTHLPDKDIVRVALTDARKEKVGGLVVGRSGRGYRVASSGAYGSTADGWRLTEAGVKWCLENAHRFRSPASTPHTNLHRQETIHKLQRVRGHALFRGFQKSPTEVVFTLGSLADLFRCRVDSPPLVWRRRLDNYRNLAQMATQEDSLAFLDLSEGFLRAHVANWPSEE